MKRKILVIVMSLMMVLTFAVPVFAEGEENADATQATQAAEAVDAADATDATDAADATDATEGSGVERLLPRLVDEADLLTDFEEEDILENLDQISEARSLDVVIAFVNSFSQSTVTAAADDFFDYNGFGIGPDRDGIVMYVCMGTRDVWFSTRGQDTFKHFTDANIQNMTEDVVPYLSSGDYAEACQEYIDCVEYYTGTYTDGGSDGYGGTDMPKSFSLMMFAIVFGLFLAGGFILGTLRVGRNKAKLVSVRFKSEANNYVRSGSYKLRTRNVRHVRTDRHRVYDPLPDDDDDSSGGTSIHIGSSGASHGGGGSKF